MPSLLTLLEDLANYHHVETRVENNPPTAQIPRPTTAKPTNLPTAAKNNKTKSIFTHSRHTPIPTIFHNHHNRNNFGQSLKTHSLHSLNKNNNFIIKVSMEGAKCTY